MSDSESKRKFFSGRSVEQAVMAAASFYGVAPDELKYRELEKRHGFVRTRRKVVIALDPEDLRKSPEDLRKSPEDLRKAPEDLRKAPEDLRKAPEPRQPPPEAPSPRRDPAGEKAPRPAAKRPRRPAAPEEAEAEAPEERPSTPPRRPPAEPARTPWWQARPVGAAAEGEEEEEEGETLEQEAAEGQEGETVEQEAAGEEEGEAGEREPAQQPAAGERPRRGTGEGRYRFVESSEGLRRRGPLPGAAGEVPERGAAGRRGAAPPRAAAPGRRDEPAPRDRSGRGRGPRAGRGGSRRGGRRERGRAETPPESALPPLPRPAPRAERLPRVEGELADAAREALDLLLELADVEAESDLFMNEERLEVELWGPDDHLLLQDDGQLLLAIEHLLPRMLRGLYGDAMPVRVDCNDFHVLREERLRELALRTADDVRRRGRPWTLDELDPAERRIVHLTLADDPDVTTDSIGDGFYKRLKVIPREEED